MSWLQEEDDGEEEQTTEQKTPIPYDVNSLFPYPSYREYQKSALREAARALYVEDFQTVILNLPTGIGKCISEGTRVSTTDGMKKIENVEVGDIVRSYDEGEFVDKPVNETYDLGEKDTVEITTKYGNQLEASEEHKIKIIDSYGQLTWMDMDEIHEGDWVPVVRGDNNEIGSMTIDHVGAPSDKGRKLPEEIEMTDELAEYLGWFVADGNIYENTARVTCAEHAEEDMYRRVDSAFSNLEPKVADYNNKSAVDIQIHSSELTNLLSKHCYNGKDKKIPGFIFKSPEEIKSAFLVGLFGGDGTYNKSNISLSTIHESLAKDLQTLLLTIGITSQRSIKNGTYKGDKHQSWRINISSREIDLFNNKVGEFYSDSQTQMEDLIDKDRNPNIDVIPNINWKLRSLWNQFKGTKTISELYEEDDVLKVMEDYKSTSNPRKPSKKQLKRFLDRVDMNTRVSEHLEMLHGLPVRFEKVEDIKSGSSRVYDLNIPETHNYTANGFISHNSGVNVALGRMAEDALYTTPSKKLRNQLKNDDDLREHYSVLGGRDSYYCTSGGTTCDECPIRYSEDNSCRSAAGCNYWGAKENAMADDLSVLTFAYLTLDSQIPVESEDGQQLSFDDRELLIVDEAQSLIQQASSLFAGFEASAYELPTDVFGNCSDFLSEDDWLFEDVTNALDHVEKNAKEYIRNNEHREDPETQFEVEQCEEFAQKYSWATTQVEAGRDWVANVEEAYPQDDLDDTLMVSIHPVDSDNFLNQRVWNRAEKYVLSTATMPYSSRPEKWLRQLGLNPDRVKVIDRPIPFDEENRRVHTDTIIDKMSGGGFYDNRHEVIDTLQELAAKHSGEKGLIHTASYSRADMLAKALSDNAIKHDNSKPSDVVIDEWQKSDKQMLLSPSMMEGVDLKDDLVRFQVLVKCPFPSMGDPRTKFLLEERSAWGQYYEDVGTKLIQSVGRGVRSEDDYCSYYVLDSAFNQTFNRASMPDWFAEAVEGYDV